MTTLLHVGIHESLNRNAGDTVLFPLVRRAIERLGPVDWRYRQLWEHLDAEGARRLGDVVDGVVVGGGGLLLRDQAGAEASVSGWQWNASTEAVEALPVPLVVFAIGYNRFRGQPDFDEPFTEHIRATVARSAFFGLRNSGSIRALRAYLPADLHDRLRLQPCPTTVLPQLDEGARALVDAPRPAGPPVLALNVAFDREPLRFGDRGPEVRRTIAEAVARAAGRGWVVRYVAHKEMDLAFLDSLADAGATAEVVDVGSAGPEATLAAYATCDLAVGARGHAQMIPFGLRRPIVSLISHDKLAWFLEDVGHPEWGVEVDDPDLGDRLDAAIGAVEDRPDGAAEDVRRAQDRLWAITEENLGRIGEALPSLVP